MRILLDASVLVALTLRETGSDRIDSILETATGSIVTTDFALAETASALSRLGRAQNRRGDEIDGWYGAFDLWIETFAERETIARDDVASAGRWVRRRDFALRAPDAIHIASARRLEATLVTLDIGMSRASRAVGVACINPAEAA